MMGNHVTQKFTQFANIVRLDLRNDNHTPKSSFSIVCPVYNKNRKITSNIFVVQSPVKIRFQLLKS